MAVSLLDYEFGGVKWYKYLCLNQFHKKNQPTSILKVELSRVEIMTANRQNNKTKEQNQSICKMNSYQVIDETH